MRAKTLFRNYQDLTRRWLAGTQPVGHTRQYKMFFEDNRMYSFGYHYTAGMYDISGTFPVVFVNGSRYSSTTSNHTSTIRWMAGWVGKHSGERKWVVLDTRDMSSIKAARAGAIHELKRWVEKSVDALDRKFPCYYDTTTDPEAARYYEQAERYHKYYKAQSVLDNCQTLLTLLADGWEPYEDSPQDSNFFTRNWLEKLMELYRPVAFVYNPHKR